MIEEIVKERMNMAGLTQAKLAEMAGCTPTQMGIFLKGSGFLNKSCFEKCLSVLGIRLDIYDKRFKTAQKAAQKLKTHDSEEIVKMPKSKMAEITGLPEIACLFDVSEAELDNIVGSGIVDYENTFPYFKSTVLHLIEIGDKATPKAVEKSFSKLAAKCAVSSILPMIGAVSLIGLATGLLLSNKSYSNLSKSVVSPFMVLTKQMLKK